MPGNEKPSLSNSWGSTNLVIRSAELESRVKTALLHLYINPNYINIKSYWSLNPHASTSKIGFAINEEALKYATP